MYKVEIKIYNVYFVTSVFSFILNFVSTTSVAWKWKLPDGYRCAAYDLSNAAYARKNYKICLNNYSPNSLQRLLPLISSESIRKTSVDLLCDYHMSQKVWIRHWSIEILWYKGIGICPCSNDDYSYRIVSVIWDTNLVFVLYDDVSCDVASSFSKPGSHFITRNIYDWCKKYWCFPIEL